MLTSQPSTSATRRAGRVVWMFSLTILIIEFLDELVFGVEGAVLPVVRTELALTYAQIGLLFSVPKLFANIVEPALGILGDTWKRKTIVLGGAGMFALALALTASAQGFVPLLIAFSIFNPASGAFVSLSQATLMDLHPTRHEQMMARWTLAGSLGVVAGPLLVSAALSMGLGWRTLYAGLAVATLVLARIMWRQPDLNGRRHEEAIGFRAGVRLALRALRSRSVLRWLVLLESADLLLDVFLGFIALYFVDVVHVDEAQAAMAVGVWSIASLIGDVLIIPLLERVHGLAYLRWSAIGVLAIYVAFLATSESTLKLVLLAGLGLGVSGWYAILKGRLYSAMPGQSGISMAIGSVTGVAAGLLPAALGLVAERFGLPTMMALLAIGPLSLLAGLPRPKRDVQ